MGTKYSSQSPSGYNSSPPADDGSATEANRGKWATIISKVGGPLYNWISAIDTALVSFADVGPEAKSSAYTTTAADHNKTIEVTGTTTITLGALASMGAGYTVTISNNGSNTVTVDGTSSETINGVTSFTLPPDCSVTVQVNSAASEYYILHYGGLSSTVSAPGTVVASKLLSVDANRDIATIRNLTSDGTVQATTGTFTNLTKGGSGVLVSSDIGSSVQAYDADLAAIAALSTQAYGRSILTTTSEANFKATVNLEIGTDVQAYDADLTTIAGLAKTDGNFIVGNGSAWVAESGSTARASLGLEAGSGGTSMVLLDSATASASATLELTTGISSTYDVYEIRLVNIIPATDAQPFYLQVSTNGGSSYSNTNYTTTDSATTSAFVLAATLGNDAGRGWSGVVRIYRPSGASHNTFIDFHGAYFDASTGVSVASGAGQWDTTTAVNAVRILMDSGNIASGDIYLYGVKKA